MISFTRVTWYSQIIAIVVFVGTFFLGIYFGKLIAEVNAPQVATVQVVDPIISSATYFCKNNKFISGTFRDAKVDLVLSDRRKLSLLQVISASGARYANINESFVFWNKGNTAFILIGINECDDVRRITLGMFQKLMEDVE